jgi:hypothetical protein
MTALRCALCWLTKGRPGLAVLVVNGQSSCEPCWQYLYTADSLAGALQSWKKDHPEITL